MPESTDKHLQFSFQVRSAQGQRYSYGGLLSGYAVRLENGSTFAGGGSADSLVQSIATGDMALSGSPWYSSVIRKVRVLGEAISGTATSISISHYADGSASTTSLPSIAPTSTHRVFNKSVSLVSPNATFHGLRLSYTVDQEPLNLLGLSVLHESSHLDMQS